MKPSVATSRESTAESVLGYFPSIAAHAAHPRPCSLQDSTELSRLRKLVKEYKAEIVDLSSRLVKVKELEVQKPRHSIPCAINVQDSVMSDSGQHRKPDLPGTGHSRLNSTTKSVQSTPNIHCPTPLDQVYQITDLLCPRATFSPQQHVKTPQQLDHQRDHSYVQKNQTKQPPPWWGQPQVNSFNAQFSQVEWQVDKHHFYHDETRSG